jgi:hypothetical protein
MKYAILKDGALITKPSTDCREPDANAGETKVKCFFNEKSYNSILSIQRNFKLETVDTRRAIFLPEYDDTSLEQAKVEAKKLLGELSNRTREAGFVSSITGQWTGVTSKDNILRAKPVADLARQAASVNGKSLIDFKLATTGDFIELTADMVVAIDEETNGLSGFIQSCYKREAACVRAINALDNETSTPETVSTLYNTLSDLLTWPVHGKGD